MYLDFLKKKYVVGTSNNELYIIKTEREMHNINHLFLSIIVIKSCAKKKFETYFHSVNVLISILSQLFATELFGPLPPNSKIVTYIGNRNYRLGLSKCLI